MPNPHTIDSAFAELGLYDRGSSRAALLGLDQAVAAAEHDAASRAALEQRFLAALKTCPSAVAREYICAKLARLGSDAAVRALAPLLKDRELALAARHALDALPGQPATQALREALPAVEGLLKVGVIDSLGARRDAGSVSALSQLLGDKDPEISHAAAAALGHIGTVKAAKALQGWLKHSQATGQPVGDALLICAERLTADGRRGDAQALYHWLEAPAQPAHLQAAAKRGLQQLGTW